MPNLASISHSGMRCRWSESQSGLYAPGAAPASAAEVIRRSIGNLRIRLPRHHHAAAAQDDSCERVIRVPIRVFLLGEEGQVDNVTQFRPPGHAVRDVIGRNALIDELRVEEV